MKKVLLMGLLLGVFVNVNAEECSPKILNKLYQDSSKVKVNYDIYTEQVEGIIPDTKESTVINVDRIRINMYYLTDQMFVVQTSKSYKDYDIEVARNGSSNIVPKYANEKIIEYKDLVDGVYSFIDEDYYFFVDYKFEIYSNVDNCDTKLLRTITYRKPKYNSYSENSICDEYPDVSLCAKYIANDINIVNHNFEESVLSEVNRKKSENKGAVEVINNITKVDFISKYKYYMIGGSAFILVIVVYIIINKKRSKL